MRKAEMLEYIATRFDKINRMFPEFRFLKFPEEPTNIPAPFVKEAYNWLRGICTAELKEYTILRGRHSDEVWAEYETHTMNFEEVKIMKAAKHKAYAAITNKTARPTMVRKSYGKSKQEAKRARSESRSS